MSKYGKLTSYLRTLKTDRWEVDFKHLEALIDLPLPRSAYSYPAWWSNQTDDGHSQSASWQLAGWKTADLNLEKRRVSFVRQTNSKPVGAAENANSRGLSIAQAKTELADFYGVAEDQIEITIRG